MFASVRFPALRSLRLSTKVDARLAAAVLHACPLVTHLFLDDCELQPAAAAMLMAKPGLLVARLRAIVVTQPDMAFWAPLALRNPTLCSLYVECCKYLNITDAPELPALRTLLLHDTSLYVPWLATVDRHACAARGRFQPRAAAPGACGVQARPGRHARHHSRRAADAGCAVPSAAEAARFVKEWAAALLVATVCVPAAAQAHGACERHACAGVPAADRAELCWCD
jgi:hypothetical protein